MVGYTEAIANLLPLIARAAYAASRIGSNLKGTTKQFGWLQASAINVLSCERVSGTLQPSECLGEFVQADGWVRLPVTPLNPGSGKLRRTFLMSRSPHGSSRFEFRIRPEKSRRLVIPRTSCWRCSRRLVRAAARPSARQL